MSADLWGKLVCMTCHILGDYAGMNDLVWKQCAHEGFPYLPSITSRFA